MRISRAAHLTKAMTTNLKRLLILRNDIEWLKQEAAGEIAHDAPNHSGVTTRVAMVDPSQGTSTSRPVIPTLRNSWAKKR